MKRKPHQSTSHLLTTKNAFFHSIEIVVIGLVVVGLVVIGLVVVRLVVIGLVVVELVIVGLVVISCRLKGMGRKYSGRFTLKLDQTGSL